MAFIAVTAQLGDSVDTLITRMSTSIRSTNVVQGVVGKWAKRAQEQAVKNVSNQPFSVGGETFIIKRQTGKLARSIRIAAVTPMSATLVAGDAATEYAASIEEGHGAIDMKPFLMDKVVPIRVKGPYGNRVDKGPIAYPVRGNSNQDPNSTRAKKVQKFSSTGKKAGTEYIIFRRVTATSEGWIIPPQRARPFMEAAGLSIVDGFSEELQQVVSDFYTEEGQT